MGSRAPGQLVGRYSSGTIRCRPAGLIADHGRTGIAIAEFSADDAEGFRRLVRGDAQQLSEAARPSGVSSAMFGR